MKYFSDVIDRYFNTSDLIIDDTLHYLKNVIISEFHLHFISKENKIVQLLEINPEPLIVSDTTSRFLAIFGGIKPLVPSNQVVNDSKAISHLQKEIVEFTDDLTPLLDEAYRIEMSAFTSPETVETEIDPFKKKLRSMFSTSDWKLENNLIQTFQTLRNIILEQFLDGRHTAFGLSPSTKQLYFTHMLQKDSRKIHEFIGLLQTKILDLFSLRSQLHYFSQKNNVNITVLLENLGLNTFVQDDDKFIYY